MSHLYLKENGKWTAQNAELLYRKENGQWLKGDWSGLDIKNYVFKQLAPKQKIHYVSLGDSIAAGHTIDENWATNYGEGSQYGYDFGNGYVRTEPTVIIPGSYTDLIRNELVNTYGADGVSAMSFARSGDTVAMLMEKLSHATVRSAIEQADIVTICIGANDVLQPALSRLDQYINTGDFTEIDNTVSQNFVNLETDSHSASYRSLFDKLNEINPLAKYVFTTVYNPYKFLHLDEGRYGFFGPLLNMIPSMELFGVSFDGMLKDGLLGTSAIQTLYSRVNNLHWWAEMNVNRLNIILNDKLNEYQAINKNFSIVYTKSLFDNFPDRFVSAPKRYNDLVHVEYTSGFNTETMNWWRLWPGSDGYTYWLNLGLKHGLDINAIATEFVADLIEKVIMPDVDPHPKAYGHYIMERAFADALGIENLEYWILTYDANGGTGTMEKQYIPTVDGLPSFVTLFSNTFTTGQEGYRITGWNTEPDGSGHAYKLDEYVVIAGVQTMYAQWSNVYEVRYRHSNHTGLYGDNETGHMECYDLWIEGSQMRKLGTFANDSGDTYLLPYNAHIIAIANDYCPDSRYEHHDARIYFNGEQKAVGRPAVFEMRLKNDLDIDFRWLIAGSLVTFDAQSWWDCHITTK